MMESVLLSISKGYISLLESEGKRVGEIWASLKENDAVRPLTAILTLNTIAHTVGALGVGVEVEKSNPGEYSLAIASALLTAAILLLSEILPKTLGSAYWKKLAAPMAYTIHYLTLLLFIIVIPIEAFRRLLPSAKSSTVTRDELVILADIGEEEGVIEEDEETVIQNLLRLREIGVEDIMTPRVVVTAFQSQMTIRQVLDEIPVLRVSRIPVYGESIDDLEGLVIRSEILTRASQGKWETLLDDIKQPISTILVGDNVDQALDIFLSQRQHLLAVVDEFGGTAGILTMEDVIETLLGEEIIDESDEVEDMRELAKQRSAAEEEE